MLDGDLLAYSSMAISLFSGLFLVAIHTLEVGDAECDVSNARYFSCHGLCRCKRTWRPNPVRAKTPGSVC